MSALASGDHVRAKKGDECYEQTFAENGGVGVVTEIHREWGGIVATVRFPGGHKTTFYADGLRRIRSLNG